MTRNIVLLTLTAACLAAAGYLFYRPARATRDGRLVMAEQLAQLVAGESAAAARGKALLIVPPDQPGDLFTRHLALRLEQALAEQGFSPLAVERVAGNERVEETGEPVTRAAFLGAFERHAGARLVVSLCGIPRLEPGDWPEKDAPWLAVATTFRLPHLLSLPEGVVDLGVVPAGTIDGPRASPAPGEAGRCFSVFRPGR